MRRLLTGIAIAAGLAAAVSAPAEARDWRYHHGYHDYHRGWSGDRWHHRGWHRGYGYHRGWRGGYRHHYGWHDRGYYGRRW